MQVSVILANHILIHTAFVCSMKWDEEWGEVKYDMLEIYKTNLIN